MTLYRVFSSHVNESCRFRGGTSPKRSTDLRALMAGFVLDAQGFGIANVTMAATAFAVPRPAVADAVILLHSEDAALLQAVLNGEVTLARAADKVRARVQLIDAFKNASDDDCAAFGQAVGRANCSIASSFPRCKRHLVSALRGRHLAKGNDPMSYLTEISGVPDSDDIKPGMAHFAGSGPAGKTCEHHRGYFRTGKAKFNSRTGMIEQNPVRTLACRMFLKLTHRHGPAVNKDWRACRYFQPK